MKFMSSEENTDASMIQFYICRCVIQWTIIWKEKSRDELSFYVIVSSSANAKHID